MTDSSYRTSMRSSSIIGGSQAITVLSSLVKMKFTAVLLGPVGVGLVGIYGTLIQTAATIASMGLGNAGVRQIAAASAHGGELETGRIRRALIWASVLLAIVGGTTFWLCRQWIAIVVFSDHVRAGDLAWLSIGVAASVLVWAQTAVLIGFRRIGDLARISLGVGLLSTVLGVGTLWLWPSHAVIVLALLTPLLSLIFGRLYLLRLGSPPESRDRLSDMTREWKKMAPLGAAFMVSGLILIGGQLITRTLVQHELGSEALGHFQAASTIGVTYLGFVLSAMGTDYFPRLTAAVADRTVASRLINEQTEVALLLCAPVILILLGFIPWVIPFFYSPQFNPAIEILRWQLLGDVLKVISWPIAFLQQAMGAVKTFVVTETLSQVVTLTVVAFGLPIFGVTATGISYFINYALYVPCVWWLGRRWIGFRWTKAVKLQAAVLVLAVVSVDLLSRWSPISGAVVGAAFGLTSGIWALGRLSAVSAAGGRLARLGHKSEQVKRWLTGQRFSK